MNKLEKALNEINLIERLSLKNTIIHKLNPISKLAVTIIYIVMVTSCYRYSISALLPWFIYPIVILILSELPIIQTLKRLLIIMRKETEDMAECNIRGRGIAILCL